MGVNFISISRLWLVRPIGQEMVVAISNLINVVFCPLLGPMKFHPNQTENTEVENFHRWSVLVGWAGRLKNGRRHFKLILYCFCSSFNLHIKIYPSGTKKTRKFKIFIFGRFWLVGLVGRKMVVGI